MPLKGKNLIAYDPVGSHIGGHAPTEATHAMDHIAHQVKGGLSGGKAIDRIAHQAKGGVTGGKAVDRIAHRTIEHKVGDHIRPDTSAQTDAQLAAKPAAYAPDRMAAAKVSGSPDANSISKLSKANTDLGVSGPYSVKAGDNLWDIARRQLGSGARWKEIYNLNSKVLGDNPSLIHVGTQLQLPGHGTDIATSAVGAAGDAHKYVVQSGDCLWKIARDHLGGGEKWGQIFQANHQVIGDNPRLIMPGQELNLTDATQVASANSAISPSLQSSHLPAATPPSAQSQVAFGQPNTQAAPVEAVGESGAGAVQAATSAQKVASASVPSQTLPKSLTPDLSFLKKKH